MRCPICPALGLSALALATAALLAAAPGSQDGGRKWGVHDKERPQPAMVTPGGHGKAPSDAVVLFDGSNLDAWTGGAWEVKDGYFQVKPGSGNIRTKEGFGSCQLHIEWMIPADRECNGQQGCNSGVFFMDRYELQILGSNPNKTYVDGMAGAMYGQYPPLVNACNPNGQWNTYDVIFHAPKFHADGLLAAHPADGFFLKGPQQFSLHRQGQLSHLVKQQRTLVGLFKRASSPVGGSGESPLFVAEQFGFEQPLGNCRAIHLDHWLIART